MADRERWFVLHAGEIEDWAVGFSGRLNTGETLDGVTKKVTVHERTGTKGVFAGVTVSDITVNASELTDADGVVHGASEAVEFRVTAANDATEGRYTLRTECSTTAGRSLVDTTSIDLQGPPEA